MVNNDLKRLIRASPSMPNLNSRTKITPTLNFDDNPLPRLSPLNPSSRTPPPSSPPTTTANSARKLLTPGNTKAEIQHSESNYSFNMSVIDMYGDVSPSSSQFGAVSGEFVFSPNNFNGSDINDDSGSENNTPLTPNTPVPQSPSMNRSVQDEISPPIKTIPISKVRSSIQENSASTINSLLQSDTDRYGFKKQSSFVSKEEYNRWFAEYSKYLIRRKKKWEVVMKNNGLNFENDSPVRFPPKSDKVKKYIRKGIPAEWRGNAWFYYARGYEKLNANRGVYDKIISETLNIKNKDTEIIERDLNRTFPDNIYFRTEEMTAEMKKNGGSSSNLAATSETPLIQSLRRVLVGFANYQPHIGYCQSLNFLAGLLLVFMDEEKAFWMLVIMTQRYLPGVHDVNLEGVNVDQGVLMLCAKEYLPSMWQKIGMNFEGKKLTDDTLLSRLPPITLCTASWFMSAFVGVMPIETVLRVWDCIFYEESKTLFRISLTVLKLCEPDLSKYNDQMEVFQYIQNFPKKLIDPFILFDTCFKKRNGFGSLSQDEINRCRRFVSEQRKKMNKTSSSSSNATSSTANLTSSSANSLSLDHHEIYGFKKGLPGVHWNKSLTNRMKKFRKSAKV